MSKFLLLFLASAWGAVHYNEAYRSATHNSYWVKRNNVVELFASGAQERLLDQLLFEHVRGLELDVHKLDWVPGRWDVYHTNMRSNVFCTPFYECLKQLRQFHYALPRHEAVTVVIELKELLEHNFDAKHTPADFDAILENYLGDLLYRPRDFLARCPSGATMRDCARLRGWPTLQELRGKFIFAVLGNWRWCYVGHGASGWATYATWGGGVRDRSGFPMQSDWGDFSKETCGNEYIPPHEVAAAEAASVFLQVEDPGDAAYQEHVRQSVADGIIIRADGSDLHIPEQEEWRSLGVQMYQTDYPWIQLNDQGPAQPFKAFDPRVDHAELVEPGYRLAYTRFGAGTGYGFAARAEAAGGVSDWETLPSTTRPSPNSAYPNPYWTRGKACLRAESATESFAICRQTFDGKWYISKPVGEDAVISIETRSRVRSQYKAVYSADNSSRGAGDQIRMVVDSRGGPSCVLAYTASEIGFDGKPLWKPVASKCFQGALLRQGPSAQWGDVLFVGTKRNGAPVAAAELSPIGHDTGYRLTDLSLAW
jgi:hypothetical protein